MREEERWPGQDGGAGSCPGLKESQDMEGDAQTTPLFYRERKNAVQQCSCWLKIGVECFTDL